MPGKNKHFTYDERVFIQQNLNKLSFKEIGRKLDKDCTSISREEAHHYSLHRFTGQGVQRMHKKVLETTLG